MLMALNKKYAVTTETFDTITAYWSDPDHKLEWDCLFIVPGWLKVWWQTYGTGWEPHLCSIRDNDELIGIAPLLFQQDKARLIGSPDVCDYQDVMVIPGCGRVFFQHLIPYLRQQGISRLDLGVVRADSIIFSDLLPSAKSLNCKVFSEPEDVTMELDLPSTWDEFLKLLTGKERHEIRRKLRRLKEAARVNFRVVESRAEVSEAIDLFLALFKMNRSDKSDFMTEQRASFFRSLAAAMAEARILKLFFLDLDEAPAAAVMCFDYNSTVYLYNNGYDNQYRSLSVGLLSKVLAIQDSIQRGKNKYNFLKGTEAYKHRLGGKPVQLYRCQVEFG
ncbi:MAG: GNAT family N-acetyltransferase [Desulfobacterales bacterium]|jgi:CelD/BcsL family acetyltransferase involved in cellulose biosynthesis